MSVSGSIKIIFFDAAGTLFYLTQNVGEHYALVAREIGVDLSPDALEGAFVRAWKNAPTRSAIGQPRDDDDKGWWRELVDRVLVDLPKVPEDFDRDVFFELAYSHFAKAGVWALYPDVPDVLHLLAPHFRLAVISNFDRRLRAILEHLGIASFFDHVFLSSEVGADKPDPEIYRRALRLSGFAAIEALHVGDDPKRDWAGAAAVGLDVFPLDRSKNSLRDLISLLSE